MGKAKREKARENLAAKAVRRDEPDNLSATIDALRYAVQRVEVLTKTCDPESRPHIANQVGPIYAALSEVCACLLSDPDMDANSTRDWHTFNAYRDATERMWEPLGEVF